MAANLPSDLVWEDELPKDLVGPSGVPTRMVRTQPGAEPDALPDRPQASFTGSTMADAALSGAAQGASLGFADELAGAASAGKQGLTNLGRYLGLLDPARNPEGETLPSPSVGDVYRAERDRDRAQAAADQAAHPVAYGAGEFAGSVLPALAAGPAAATPAGAAVLGGAAGLGHSKADLTAGDVGRAAIDTGTSALLSAGASAAGNKLGQWLRDRAARGVAAATDSARSTATKAITDAGEKLRSSAGGKTTAASRSLRTVDEAVDKVADPELKKALAALRDSPGATEMYENIARNVADDFGSQLPAAQAARKEAAEFAAKIPQSIDEKTAELLANPLAKSLPALKTLASRNVIPLVSAGLGSAVGGLPGAGIGMLAGGVLGAMGGRQNTILANRLRDPAVRNAIWSLVNKGAVAPELAGQATAAGARTGVPQELIDYLLRKRQDEGQGR